MLVQFGEIIEPLLEHGDLPRAFVLNRDQIEVDHGIIFIKGGLVANHTDFQIVEAHVPKIEHFVYFLFGLVVQAHPLCETSPQVLGVRGPVYEVRELVFGWLLR